MSAQQKTNKDLADLLHVSVRQAIRLKNGEQEFRFADLDIVAPWLGLTDAGVLVSGDPQALMAAVG